MAMIRRLSFVHNFQRSSSLKPLGQSKTNFIGGTKVFINNPGHMTMTAAMPIYSETPSKSSSLEPLDRFQQKLCMRHRGIKYYNVFINHDPVMTMAYFTTRSTYVTHAFEWENS